jgi:2-polyprenyl-6-methoxyphenol hydroxylase-like FAD-dependent oxidoreductase
MTSKTSSQQSPAKNVLIVGGGIAGLSMAIALGKKGIATTVLERGDGASGTVIRFHYRPVYALQELGILEELERQGRPVSVAEAAERQARANASGTGDSIVVPQPIDSWTVPLSLAVYRPVLANIMKAAAREQGAELLIGHSYETLEQHHDRVDVRLTTGEKRSYDLVVAADGINSGLRDQFFPETGSPIYTGSMSFRAMFGEASDDWTAGIHMRNGRVVVTEIVPGDLLYLAVPARMERQRLEQDQARQIIRKVLVDYSDSPMFTELHDRINDDTRIVIAPYEWVLVPPPWHRGRVVLAGDAAHATAPTIGSAGGMALEDAVVLGDALAGADDLETALTAYCARRWERAKLVVETSAAVMKLQQDRRPRDEWATMRKNAFSQLAEAY